MSYLNEKIENLKELTLDLNINEKTNEGKIILSIIDTLDCIVKNADKVDEEKNNYNFICPHCSETIHIDTNTLEENEVITCPICSESIYIFTHDI